MDTVATHLSPDGVAADTHLLSDESRGVVEMPSPQDAGTCAVEVVVDEGFECGNACDADCG